MGPSIAMLNQFSDTKLAIDGHEDRLPKTGEFGEDGVMLGSSGSVFVLLQLVSLSRSADWIFAIDELHRCHKLAHCR